MPQDSFLQYLPKDNSPSSKAALQTVGGVQWKDTNAPHYVNDPNWKMLGYDMNRNNDYAYDDAQTTGQWLNSVAHRFMNPLTTSFMEGFRYDKTVRELFNPGDSLSEDKGLQDYIKKSQELQNLYPTYDNPNSGDDGFLSYFNSGARNKWSSLLESSGFMVGTALSGIAQSVALGLVTSETGGWGAAVGLGETVSNLGKTYRFSKLASAYKKMDKVNDLWRLSKIGKIVGASPTLQAIDGLTDLAKAKGLIPVLKASGKFIGNSAIRFQATSSEAMLEAIDGSEAFKKTQLQDFENKNGRPANKEEKDAIENYAADLFSARYKANLGVLSVTNLVQDLSFFNTFKYLSKLGKGGAIAEKAAEKWTWSRKAGEAMKVSSLPFKEKFLYGAKSVGGSLFRNTFMEGVEEGAQYAIQKTADDYYTKKYNKEAVSFMDSMAKGVSSTFTDKEGVDSIWSGIMMGGLFSGIGKGARMVHSMATGTNQKVNTTADEQLVDYQKAHDNVVKTFKTELIMSPESENATLTHSNNLDAEEAMKNGDVDKAKALRIQTLRNAVRTAKEVGKIDLLKKTLQEYGDMDDAVFKEKFNVTANKTNKEIVAETLNDINEIEKSVDFVNEKWGNPFDGYDNINPISKPDERAKMHNQYKGYEEAKMTVVDNMENLKQSKKNLDKASNWFTSQGVVVEDLIHAVVPEEVEYLGVRFDSSKMFRSSKIAELESKKNDLIELHNQSNKDVEKILYGQQLKDVENELDIYKRLNSNPDNMGAIFDFFNHHIEKSNTGSPMNVKDISSFKDSYDENIKNLLDNLASSKTALDAITALNDPYQFNQVAKGYTEAYGKRYEEIISDIDEQTAPEETPVTEENTTEETPIVSEEPTNPFEEQTTIKPTQAKNKPTPKHVLLRKIQEVEKQLDDVTNDVNSLVSTKVGLKKIIDNALLELAELVKKLNESIIDVTPDYNVYNHSDLLDAKNRLKNEVEGLQSELQEIEAQTYKIEKIRDHIANKLSYYNKLRKEKGIRSNNYENIIYEKIQLMERKVKFLDSLIKKIKKAVERLFADLQYVVKQLTQDQQDIIDYPLDTEVDASLTKHTEERIPLQGAFNLQKNRLKTLSRTLENSRDIVEYLYELLDWGEKNNLEEPSKPIEEVKPPKLKTLSNDISIEEAAKEDEEITKSKEEQIKAIDELISEKTEYVLGEKGLMAQIEEEERIAEKAEADIERKKEELKEKLRLFKTPKQILAKSRQEMYNNWLPIAMKDTGLTEKELIEKIDKEGIIKKAQKEYSDGNRLTNVEQFALYLNTTRASIDEVKEEQEEYNKINEELAALESGKSTTDTKTDNIKNRNRKDLFPDESEFADVVGGSGKNSKISSYKEVNGIGISEYTNPENGLVDVIMTGTSDNDYVGYVRVYSKSIVNGKVVITPTERWTSKMENKSQNKANIKTMLAEVQKLLPAGHEYTEKTNISLDGLKTYAQQLDYGYEILLDNNGNPVVNQIILNKASVSALQNAKSEKEINDLYKSYENLTRTEYNEIKAKINALMPEARVLPFNETNGTISINLPVLKSTKIVEPTTDIKTSTENIETKKADIEKEASLARRNIIKSKLPDSNWDVLVDETKRNIRNIQESPLIDGHGISRVENGKTQLGVLLQILDSQKMLGDWGKLVSNNANVMGAWISSSPFIITGLPNTPLANITTKQLNPYSVILNGHGEGYYEALSKRYPNVNFIIGSELTKEQILNAKYDAELAALKNTINKPRLQVLREELAKVQKDTSSLAKRKELLTLKTEKKNIEQEINTPVKDDTIPTVSKDRDIQDLTYEEKSRLAKGILESSNIFLAGMVFKTAAEDMEGKEGEPSELRKNRSEIGKLRAKIRNAISNRVRESGKTLNDLGIYITLQKDKQEFHPTNESVPEKRYFEEFNGDETKHPIVAVLSDANGKPLLFNENGEIVAKNGTFIVQQVYEVEHPSEKNKNNKTIEQRIEERQRKRITSYGLDNLFVGDNEGLSPEEKESINNEVVEEFSMLAKVKQHIRKTDEKFTVSNITISKGFAENDEVILVQNAELLNKDESDLTIETTSLQQGNTKVVSGMMYYNGFPALMPKLREKYMGVIQYILNTEFPRDTKAQQNTQENIVEFLNNILYIRNGANHPKALDAVRYNYDTKHIEIHVDGKPISLEQLLMRDLSVNIDKKLFDANNSFTEYSVKDEYNEYDEKTGRKILSAKTFPSYTTYLKNTIDVVMNKSDLTAQKRKIKTVERFNIVFGMNPSEVFSKLSDEPVVTSPANIEETVSTDDLFGEPSNGENNQSLINAFSNAEEKENTVVEPVVEKPTNNTEELSDEVKTSLTKYGIKSGAVFNVFSESKNDIVSVKVEEVKLRNDGQVMVVVEQTYQGENSLRSYKLETFIDRLNEDRKEEGIPQSSEESFLSDEDTATEDNISTNGLFRVIKNENLFKKGVTQDDLINMLINRNIVEKICNL